MAPGLCFCKVMSVRTFCQVHLGAVTPERRGSQVSAGQLSDFDMCAQSLIDFLKVRVGWDVRANAMAGRLWHQIMEARCPATLKQYLGIFRGVLGHRVESFIQKNIDALEDMLCAYRRSKAYEDTLNCGYLSAVRLYDTYVLRTMETEPVYESVAQMFMRVSVFVACQCLEHECLYWLARDLIEDAKSVSEMAIVEYVFGYLAAQHVCCATPILRSAGVEGGQLASCFILQPSMMNESGTLDALYHDMSPLLASKSGVGLDVTSFSHQKNIASCLKLVDAQVHYFNDNNIRPVGASAYMELWHSQICDFLNAKLPENPDRCHSLFQGVCIPTLFFRMYEKDPSKLWYLFDPATAPNLIKLYGAAFDNEYERLVRAGKYVSCMPLKSMMFTLIHTIIKTGSPYVLLKEALNEHHWTDTQGMAINCSNLCAEIVQLPGRNTSVCNLANICLPKCLRTVERARVGTTDANRPFFCFEALGDAVRVAVLVINACILGGSHPTPGVERGQKERSMGIGVQGLADVFAELGYGYLDAESAELDKNIFQSMYYTAVETSHNLVLEGQGVPFHGWEVSNFAKGRFHWQTWEGEDASFVPRHRWDALGKSIAEHGIFNSQFLAVMPTAGTSQVTGYAESVYPFFANISSKVTNKEEVLRPNVTFFKKVLPDDLRVVRQYGGDVSTFPKHHRERYRVFLTAFDYCPFKLLDRARARAPFVDQSQSMSFFLKEDRVRNASYLRDLLLHGYRLGLKTLMYYCRVQKQSSLTALQCLADPGSPPHSGMKQDGAWLPGPKNPEEQSCAADPECLVCQ